MLEQAAGVFSLAASCRRAASRSVTSSIAISTRSHLPSCPGRIAALELDVEPAPGQRIVHRVAEELRAPFPELHEFVDVGLQHVVAKDPVEIADQMRQVIRLEEAEGPAVHLDDTDPARAGLDACRILQEIIAAVEITPSARQRSKSALRPL